jgi:hypothetical protein
MKSGRQVIGEPFDPWHGACGFYPPDVVGRQRDLTDGQKRLYERAVRWAGKNGRFWRSFPTIAEALGKSVRQVKDDMATLEEKGLMGHTRRRRDSNVYHFLWHSIFEVQYGALQDPILKVQDSPVEVQSSVKKGPLKVQSTAPKSCPSLNFVQESSSKASTPVREKCGTDDENLPGKENPTPKNPEGIARPEGESPLSLAKIENPMNTAGSLPREILQKAAEQLQQVATLDSSRHT